MKETNRMAAFVRALAVLLVFAALGCRAAPGATAQTRSGREEAKPEAEAVPEIPPEPPVLRHAAIPENPSPGYPVTVGVTRGFGVDAAVLTMGGKKLGRATFFTIAGDGENAVFDATLITIPSTAGSGPAVIVLEAGGEPVAEIPIEVAQREFRSETIRVNPQMAGIQADNSPERREQARHLWAVLGKVGDDVHFTGGFVKPVDSERRTSVFGSRRVFVNGEGGTSTSIHAGVDFGVPLGTTVLSGGGGKVVLARDRIVSGKSIIIEHLPGVFSIYYHLDHIGVAEGETVAAGVPIGRSGSTGFSTGPHLHWEVRVFGENTDPDALTARPLIDINAILAKLEL